MVKASAISLMFLSVHITRSLLDVRMYLVDHIWLRIS